MDTPDYIAIFKDARRGWFLLQEFDRPTDAIVAAEGGAMCFERRAPGQVFFRHRSLSKKKDEVPDRVRRKLFGSDLRKFRWGKIERKDLPALMFENRERRLKTEALKRKLDIGTATLGECAAAFAATRFPGPFSVEAINSAAKRLHDAEWTPPMPGTPESITRTGFYPVKDVIASAGKLGWPSTTAKDLHEETIGAGGFLRFTDDAVKGYWVDPKAPDMEVRNRIDLDNLGKHTSEPIKIIQSLNMGHRRRQQRNRAIVAKFHEGLPPYDFVALHTGRGSDGMNIQSIPKTDESLGRSMRYETKFPNKPLVPTRDASFDDSNEADGFVQSLCSIRSFLVTHGLELATYAVWLLNLVLLTYLLFAK